MIRTEKNRYSNAYVMTVDLQDETDMMWLSNLRKKVKEMNKFRRAHDLNTKYDYCSKKLVKSRTKIEVNGRLGKDNPNAYKYRTGRWNRHQRILLGDARFADVYVREVVDFPYGRG